MKHFIKLLFLILVTLSFSCNNNHSNNKNTTAEVQPKEIETPNESFKFEAGDYNISWAGHPFKTTLTKTDNNTLTGRFCVNNNITNCKDLGPITIIKNGNMLTFKFLDLVCRISDEQPGEFAGTGKITNNNVYNFLVNGSDCKEKPYVNNRVIFTKL